MKNTQKPITTGQMDAIRKMALQIGRRTEDFTFQASSGRTTTLAKLTYTEGATIIRYLDDVINSKNEDDE